MGRQQNNSVWIGEAETLYGQTPEHARTIFEFNPRDRPELGIGQPQRAAGWTSSAGASIQNVNGRDGMAPNATVPAAAANIVALTSPGFYAIPGTIFDVMVEIGRVSDDALLRVTGSGLARLGSPFYELVDTTTGMQVVTVKMRTNIYIIAGNNIQVSSQAAGNIRPVIYSLKVVKTVTNIP